MVDQNSNKFFNKSINSDNNKEDEIDLLEIFKVIRRNKLIVFIFCFFSVIFSSYLVLNTKRTYQGGFQIVLAKEKALLQIANRPELQALNNIGLGKSSDQLKTEVGILKSPSVLMDIFEYVKKEKLSRNDDSYENMRFKSWRESYLNIALEKGTSILNLDYKDTDKDLIIPVLNKISETYQSYSGEKRLREIELDTKFFDEQILIYKNKIKNSQEEMEEFGQKYNLSLVQSEVNKGDDSDAPPTVNVEAMRNQVFDLDNQLSVLRSIYAESDKKIQNTIMRKSALIRASERPPGVVIKYKQLIDEVRRDKKTVFELENSLRLINLEKARNKDPWRLLTKPTLLPNPVAPRRKRFVFTGGIIGLLIGSLVAYRYEKSKGIIFSAREMQSLSGLNVISELFIKNDSWSDTLYLIVNNLILEKKGLIGILINDEIDNFLLRKVETKLEKFISNKELLLTSDIKLIDQCVNSVFLTSLGTTSENSLINIKDRILFKENKIMGIIVLNNL